MKLYASIITLLFFLGGCAVVPEKTYNVEQHNLKSIALATPEYDKNFLLRFRNDQLETVDAFTRLPVGKLFAYVAKENREAEFTEKSSTPAESFANSLYTQLELRLQKDSYRIVTADLPVAEELKRQRNGLLKTIPARAFNGADALLETTGGIGFTAAGRGKPFEPSLWVFVRLTSADGKVLLQDRILYNPPETDARGLLLHSTGDYLFADEEAILNGATTAAALEQATSLVVEELSFLLKGPVSDVH